MKGTGIFLLIAGGILLAYTYSMDVSGGSHLGEEVANFSLMFDRLLMGATSLTCILLGTILFCSAQLVQALHGSESKSETLNQSNSDDADSKLLQQESEDLGEFAQHIQKENKFYKYRGLLFDSREEAISAARADNVA